MLNYRKVDSYTDFRENPLHDIFRSFMNLWLRGLYMSVYDTDETFCRFINSRYNWFCRKLLRLKHCGYNRIYSIHGVLNLRFITGGKFMIGVLLWDWKESFGRESKVSSILTSCLLGRSCRKCWICFNKALPSSRVWKIEIKKINTRL